jgi:hypothetical protein
VRPVLVAGLSVLLGLGVVLDLFVPVEIVNLDIADCSKRFELLLPLSMADLRLRAKSPRYHQAPIENCLLGVLSADVKGRRLWPAAAAVIIHRW